MQETLYEAEDESITITDEDQIKIHSELADTLGVSFLVDSTTSTLNKLMRTSLDMLFNPENINVEEVLDTFSQHIVYMKALLQQIGITGELIDEKIGVNYYVIQNMLNDHQNKIDDIKNTLKVEDTPEDVLDDVSEVNDTDEDEVIPMDMDIEDLGLHAEPITDTLVDEIGRED